MAQHNEAAALIQKQRLQWVHSHLVGTQAEMNGLEIPQPVPRFVGMECDAQDVLWAYFGDGLDEIARQFEESDTDGIFRYRAYDLDGPDTAYVPAFQVTRWVPIEGERP